MAITWQLYVNVNSTKMELTAYHVLNKHKVTKTLSNFPWCKDTKVLTGESLCLQFGGVALRAFVSLCLIVHWFFIAPPAPEASRRTNVKLIQFFNKLLERCASYAWGAHVRCSPLFIATKIEDNSSGTWLYCLLSSFIFFYLLLSPFTFFSFYLLLPPF